MDVTRQIFYPSGNYNFRQNTVITTGGRHDLLFLSTHEVRGDIAIDFSVRPSVPFLVKVFYNGNI